MGKELKDRAICLKEVIRVEEKERKKLEEKELAAQIERGQWEDKIKDLNEKIKELQY